MSGFGVFALVTFLVSLVSCLQLGVLVYPPSRSRPRPDEILRFGVVFAVGDGLLAAALRTLRGELLGTRTKTDRSANPSCHCRNAPASCSIPMGPNFVPAGNNRDLGVQFRCFRPLFRTLPRPSPPRSSLVGHTIGNLPGDFLIKPLKSMIYDHRGCKHAESSFPPASGQRSASAAGRIRCTGNRARDCGCLCGRSGRTRVRRVCGSSEGMRSCNLS